MKRRQFFKNSLTTSLALSAMPGMKLMAADEDYSGKFFINLRANGGWDTTLFCDPKENIPGEDIITHWSETDSTQTVGNINYAPFGGNEKFFNRFYKDMMVINGINTKTNSHKGGRQKMNTGGYSTPSVSALFAYEHGLDTTIPWLMDGADRTWDKGLVNQVNVSGGSSITSLINSNQKSLTNNSRSFFDEDLTLIKNFQEQQVNLHKNSQLPQYSKFIKDFQKSSFGDPKLQLFGELLAQGVPAEYSNNSLNQKVQFALSAFKSGVASSVDFATGGFDTHNRNEERQSGQYGPLLAAVHLIYDLAEQMGIDHLIVLQMESDFARTPRYNNNDGKDHWSVGSKVIIEKDAIWGNQVKGGTDGGQNSLKFDPFTLKEDSSGIVIEPKHFNYALWHYLELDQAAQKHNFELTDQLMPFFT